jgi:hypothetical protein
MLSNGNKKNSSNGWGAKCFRLLQNPSELLDELRTRATIMLRRRPK